MSSGPAIEDLPPGLAAVEAALEEVMADPNVAGVVLTGSRARTGMATVHSDVDVYVVQASADPRRRTTHAPDIDIAVVTLEQLQQLPGPADDAWWDRYSFTHSVVLLDRTDGELARLVRAWGTLSGPESLRVLQHHLDGYYNYVYRSLKSVRDGRPFEARLDAAESLVWGLPAMFAFERRIRPYNKYLVWELGQYPLQRPDWATDRLLPMLQQIQDSADPTSQRALFNSIEAAAREVGLGGIADAWDHELRFLRGT